MGAFEDFLKKQGYVKLDRYGLVLTPDDRILSTRPVVLDDGLGGKIVGWAEGDLASAELEAWGAAKKPAAASRVAVSPALPPKPPVAPAKPTRPALPGMTMAPKPAPVTVPAPAPVIAAPQVAEQPPVEEDEWEWEIAMARARAAAEDVQAAAASITSSFISPKAAAAAKASPKLAAASIAAPQDPMSQWPGTEPFNERWEATRESQAPQVMSPAAKSLAVAKSAVRAKTPVTPVSVPLFEAAAAARSAPPATSGSQSRTVIPVPTLPVAAKPSDVRPAFKPGQPPPRLAARSRLARGTDAPRSITEDTVVTAPIEPAHEDRTSPYVTLPPEVKKPGYAHTKRVAAKQR